METTKRKPSKSPSLASSASASVSASSSARIRNKSTPRKTKPTKMTKLADVEVDRLTDLFQLTRLEPVIEDEPLKIVTRKKVGKRMVNKTVDLADMLAAMDVDKAPRKVAVAKRTEPTRARTTRQQEALPELVFTLKKQPSLTKFLGDMNAVVKKLRMYEPQMKILEETLDKLLVAREKKDAAKLRNIIRQAALDDVITYINNEKESILDFKIRMEKVLPKFDKYKQKAEEKLKEQDIDPVYKKNTKMNLKNIQQMMDTYIKSYNETLYPLAMRVLEKTTNLKNIDTEDMLTELLGKMNV